MSKIKKTGTIAKKNMYKKIPSIPSVYDLSPFPIILFGPNPIKRDCVRFMATRLRKFLQQTEKNYPKNHTNAYVFVRDVAIY